MKIYFNIPQTPLVRVVYRLNGARHEATIPRPRDNEALRCVMLSRHVGMSQVLDVKEYIANSPRV